jgi:hypothetical protein
MSYIINYLFPKIKTNIEEIPTIEPTLLKKNKYDLSKIAYLKNIKMTPKMINKIIETNTGFSTFNLEQIALEYVKDNIINKDNDFTKENLNNILSTLFYQGRKIELGSNNYVIATFSWENKLHQNYNSKKSLLKDYEFSSIISLKLLKKDKLTYTDKKKIGCEERYNEIRTDTRDLFKKMENGVKGINKNDNQNIEIPVAKPLNGGKNKIKRKKIFKRTIKRKKKTKRKTRRNYKKSRNSSHKKKKTIKK